MRTKIPVIASLPRATRAHMQYRLTRNFSCTISSTRHSVPPMATGVADRTHGTESQPRGSCMKSLDGPGVSYNSATGLNRSTVVINLRHSKAETCLCSLVAEWALNDSIYSVFVSFSKTSYSEPFYRGLQLQTLCCVVSGRPFYSSATPELYQIDRTAQGSARNVAPFSRSLLP